MVFTFPTWKLEDGTYNQLMYKKNNISTLASTLRLSHLTFSGHTERIENWINKIQQIQVTDKDPPDSPLKRKKTINDDLHQ